MLKTNILRNLIFVTFIGILLYLWLGRKPKGELPKIIKKAIDWFKNLNLAQVDNFKYKGFV